MRVSNRISSPSAMRKVCVLIFCDSLRELLTVGNKRVNS